MLLLRDQPWTILSQKYDGSVHRRWTCAYPLRDRPLYQAEVLPFFSLQIPAFAKVEESDGATWSSAYDVTACFYAAKHYQVMVLHKLTGVQYYCNACSVVEIEESSRQVRYIDLDLDLLVDADGSPRMVDQEEFAVNHVRFGYPNALCERVEHEMHELMRQVRQRKGVFAPHFAWSRLASFP